MPDNKITRFFLGANSEQGFYSLYDGFARPEDGVFLYVLKGGPGCGKSSFMKRIGARADCEGLDVEYIHCSGDPESLDAVYIPALGVAYADGTSPHVLDPPYPAAGGAYLDLGSFYDIDNLKPRLAEIMALNRRYKGKYKESYALLSSAGSVAVRPLPELMTRDVDSSVRRRARSLIGRELDRVSASGTGRIDKRFLSAISCQGSVFFDATIYEIAPRVCVLDNDLGFAQAYLDECVKAAHERGYDMIVCPDCLTPEKTQAVLIPEAGLALLESGRRSRWTGEVYRHVRLDAMADTQALSQLRPAMRTAEKLRAAIIAEAEKKLAAAKALHDEVEAVYNPHVDFGGVYELVEKHAEMLGI